MKKQQGLHNILFTMGMICLCLAVGLFAFVLYILPHVLFNLPYEVPEFAARLAAYYEIHRGLDGLSTVFLVLFPFILAALVLIYVANRITHVIERDEGVEQEWEKHERDDEILNHQRLESRETRSELRYLRTIIPIASIIASVFILLWIVEGIITSRFF